MPERRKRVLNEMWPMGWHFLSGDRVRKFQSTVVLSLVSKAKSSVFFASEFNFKEMTRLFFFSNRH